MNIQIFGTKKCNDTKKAERFFKERGIKYQFKRHEQGRVYFGCAGEWWPGKYGQLGRQGSGYPGAY